MIPKLVNAAGKSLIEYSAGNQNQFAAIRNSKLNQPAINKAGIYLGYKQFLPERRPVIFNSKKVDKPVMVPSTVYKKIQNIYAAKFILDACPHIEAMDMSNSIIAKSSAIDTPHLMPNKNRLHRLFVVM